jgi:hypothetical protein
MNPKYRAIRIDVPATDGMIFERHVDAMERCKQLQIDFGGCWQVEELFDDNYNCQTPLCNSSKNALGAWWIWLILFYMLVYMGK